MIEINNKEQLTDVLKNKNVVLYFGADWCGPCRALMPRMETVSTDNPDLVVAHIDVDLNPEIAEEYEIRGIPALIFTKAGNVTDKQVGGLPLSALSAKVKTFLEN